jgi:hypothetical protein
MGSSDARLQAVALQPQDLRMLERESSRVPSPAPDVTFHDFGIRSRLQHLHHLSFSRDIHSRMYREQLSSSMPLPSQAFKNRTASTSTSVTQSRSNAVRDLSPFNCVFSSFRCSDRSQPLRRKIASCPSESFSIFNVICDFYGLGGNKRRQRWDHS